MDKVTIEHSFSQNLVERQHISRGRNR